MEPSIHPYRIPILHGTTSLAAPLDTAIGRTPQAVDDNVEPVESAGNGEALTALPDHDGPLRHTYFSKVLTFFGFGGNASSNRKTLVSVAWNLSWGFGQFVTVIILLFLVKFHLKSPTHPTTSEWDACDRPLATWAALWLIRVVLASSLAYWEFIRNRQLRHLQNRSDEESASRGTPSAPAANGTQETTPGQEEMTAVDPSSLPYTHLYSRLTLFSSLVTLIWFVSGNVLVYTSINTCRYDAPRLWWLNFAILCVLYLMVLEVVLLGFVVLIVAPILFVFWNIFLICVGRHPFQNPNAIKHEIGKLPKSIVDKIPLVNYIPAPPASVNFGKEPPQFQLYPPKLQKQKMKFKLLHIAFLGSKSSKAEFPDKQTENESDESDSWADNWQQGQYPFVTLEGNRATCAICLNDFEEPPRRPPKGLPSVEAAGQIPDHVEASASAVKALSDQTNVAEESDGVDSLKPQDARAGTQPLRLLGCEHVFHQTCIDPWLTERSGRCPVCQRPVEPSKPHKSRRL